MIQELTAGGATRPGLITRALTPFIRGSGQRMLKWKPAGSILLDLPNGQRIRFGAHSGAREPVLKLNNFGVISKSLRRGGIGFAEAYIDGDFDCSGTPAYGCCSNHLIITKTSLFYGSYTKYF